MTIIKIAEGVWEERQKNFISYLHKKYIFSSVLGVIFILIWLQKETEHDS